MSNQHSYALVLSQRQKSGQTEFHDRRRAKPRCKISKQAQLAADSLNTCLQLPTAAPPQARVRVHHDSEKERTITARARYELGEGPVVIDEDDPPEEKRPTSSRANIYDGSDYQDIDRPVTPPPWLKEQNRSPPPREYTHDDDHGPARSLSSEDSDLYALESPGSKQNDKEKVDARPQPRRTYSTDTEDTAIWAPEASRRRSSSHGREVLDTANTGPLQPLTPPLTPRLRKSWETFSLDDVERSTEDARSSFDSFSLEDEVQPSSSAFPINPRDLVATPPKSLSNNSKHSLKSHSSTLASTSQQQASPGRPPLPERESSLNAPTSPPKHQRWSSYASDDMLQGHVSTSVGLSSRWSLDSLDLDADLSPLPPDLSTDPEFADAFPWLDEPSLPDASPAPRHSEDDIPDTATILSFDSAAPPPISMGKRPTNTINRSQPHFDPRCQSRRQQQEERDNRPPSSLNSHTNHLSLAPLSVNPRPPLQAMTQSFQDTSSTPQKPRPGLSPSAQSLQDTRPALAPAKPKRKVLTKSPVFAGVQHGITTTTCYSSPSSLSPNPTTTDFNSDRLGTASSSSGNSSSAWSNIPFSTLALQKRGYPKAAAYPVPTQAPSSRQLQKPPPPPLTSSSSSSSSLLPTLLSGKRGRKGDPNSLFDRRDVVDVEEEREVEETKVVMMAGQEVRVPVRPFKQEWRREREAEKRREVQRERERELQGRVMRVWGQHLPGGKGEWGG